MNKKLLGYACLVAGIAGLALPLLPGIPLLLIGLKLLGPDHPITRPTAKLVKRPPESS
jgi:uncharacterized membrane protein YbaN (DUF454 family)